MMSIAVRITVLMVGASLMFLPGCEIFRDRDRDDDRGRVEHHEEVRHEDVHPMDDHQDEHRGRGEDHH